MITEKIRKLLYEQKLGFVATVSPDGTPNLSPKGTIIVLDENTLAFADIRSPQTMKNLKSNPSIEINVVDPISRKGFRFKGTTEIISSGEKYKKILLQYRKSGVKSSIKSIVLVKVKQASEVLSPLYDLGLTEDEIKTRWKKHYLSF
ncbi:Pyridoxamine 5'-phosphate oxidase protein [Marine Group I thaumarchaeote SCGC AAA799-O18]|jgi:predicted pyridoxine 5'-phosphate oxidase superfamily flavin-nucleotide-binding protein|nr:Pyridoxamine 5'-phosphate oxidase protein [Marine Group I thaumarchaeote SCGC AAA799-O18]